MLIHDIILRKVHSVKEGIECRPLFIPFFLVIMGLSYYVHTLHEKLAMEVESGPHRMKLLEIPSAQGLSEDERRSAVDVSWPNLAIAASPMILVLVMSFLMKLELEKPLMIGIARCTIQLTVLGLILSPIFEIEEWYFILGFSLLQTLLASREVVAVAAWHYSLLRMYIQNVFCIGVPCFLIVLFSQLYTLETEPFYNPQYWIPFSGMIIGNASRTNALVTVSLLKDLSQKQDEIEWVLSRGGTKWEATIGPVKNAISAALYPVINSMVIAGLIQIPGTMVGTILGGTEPFLAAKYQILVYILIFATSAFAGLLYSLLAVIQVFDEKNRLKVDRIRTKKKGSKDWVSALFYFIFLFFKWLFTPLCKCLYDCFGCHRCCRCFKHDVADEKETLLG